MLQHNYRYDRNFQDPIKPLFSQCLKWSTNIVCGERVKNLKFSNKQETRSRRWVQIVFFPKSNPKKFIYTHPVALFWFLLAENRPPRRLNRCGSAFVPFRRPSTKLSSNKNLAFFRSNCQRICPQLYSKTKLTEVINLPP